MSSGDLKVPIRDHLAAWPRRSAHSGRGRSLSGRAGVERKRARRGRGFGPRAFPWIDAVKWLTGETVERKSLPSGQ